MAFFNTKSSKVADNTPESCCICGQAVDRRSSVRLADNKVVCTNCLKANGISSDTVFTTYTSSKLQSYIDSRKNLVSSFSPTKYIAGGIIKLDENHESFSVNDNIFAYGNLLNFETIRETGYDETNKLNVCYELFIRISLIGAHVDEIDLVTLPSGPKATNGPDYKAARNNALRCTTALEQIAYTNRQSEAAATFSVADEISKLKALVDSGALTPDEFEAAKQRLLGR